MMPSWVHNLLDWVAANPESAGIAIFIISAVESLALIGILIPGVIILFAFGTLVGAGILPVVPVLLWAFAGAVLGDQISFWLGWGLKERLWQIWPLSRYPQFIGRSERFFGKYGAASVFIGRFIGPIRPVIPAMAGMSNMPPMRFTLVNLASAALWSPAYMLPGAVLGASMQVAGTVAIKMALLMMLAGGLAYLWAWGSGRLLIRIPAAAQGISITLFTTLLIGAVLTLVLRSGNAQLACSQYQSMASNPERFATGEVYRQGGGAAQHKQDIRYQGSLERLLLASGEAGFTIIEPTKPADFLRWLLPSPTLADLPPRVKLHCYDRSTIVVRQVADNGVEGWQWRLWQQDASEDLWLGQATTLSIDSIYGIASWPRETAVPAVDMPWPWGFVEELPNRNLWLLPEVVPTDPGAPAQTSANQPISPALSY